jgi:hypothetical protein
LFVQNKGIPLSLRNFKSKSRILKIVVQTNRRELKRVGIGQKRFHTKDYVQNNKKLEKNLKDVLEIPKLIQLSNELIFDLPDLEVVTEIPNGVH